MAKSGEKLSVVEPEETAPEGSEFPREQSSQGQPAAPAPAPAAQVAQAPTLDDSAAIACYANFCRVTGTPEEVILDLGLNPQPMGVAGQSVKVSQRLIMNYFTAKRLLGALSMTVQRHEQIFGVLETDVQKRVRPGIRG